MSFRSTIRSTLFLFLLIISTTPALGESAENGQFLISMPPPGHGQILGPLSLVKFADQPRNSKAIMVGVGHIMMHTWVAYLLAEEFGWREHQMGASFMGEKTVIGPEINSFLDRSNNGIRIDGGSWGIQGGILCSSDNFVECLIAKGQSRFGSSLESSPDWKPFNDLWRAKLRYVSYTSGVDLLIVELPHTYEWIEENMGIIPFTIYDAEPEIGDILFHFHRPFGERKATIRTCRVGNPSIDMRVGDLSGGTLDYRNLILAVEADPADIKNAMPGADVEPCRAIPGDSGNGVFRAQTNEIIGVLSTGNKQYPEMGVQPLRIMRACFDSEWNFSLYQPDCNLEQIRFHSGR